MDDDETLYAEQIHEELFNLMTDMSNYAHNFMEDIGNAAGRIYPSVHSREKPLVEMSEGIEQLQDDMNYSIITIDETLKKIFRIGDEIKTHLQNQQSQ